MSDSVIKSGEFETVQLFANYGSSAGSHWVVVLHKSVNAGSDDLLYSITSTTTSSSKL